MIKLTISALCILFSISLIWCDSDVLELNDGNFSTEIQKKSCALIKYYVDWCPYCRMLAPKFALAAETLKNNHASDRTVLVQVDCDKNPVSCQGIPGYPTIKLFSYGKLVEEYPDDYSNIVNYMIKKCHIQTFN
jgi:thioredoxin-like negative regulator of GroEL